jgi:hypothetical protein
MGKFVLMQLCELKYRASMTADPIWEKRYKIAIQYMLRDPVNIGEIDRILGGGVVEVVKERAVKEEPKTAETWRDRKGYL